MEANTTDAPKPRRKEKNDRIGELSRAIDDRDETIRLLNEALSRALSIINEGLKASLDHTQGGRIAGYLADLYDYMSRRLLFANLRNDRTAMLEVAQLLGELRSSWAAISD